MRRWFISLLLLSVGILGLGATFPQLGIVVYQDQPGQHVPTIELIKRWARENNVDVQITTITHGTRLVTATTAIEGGTGPDIIMLSNYEPALFAEALLDLSDVAIELGQENGGWFPICEVLGKVAGQWKALPIYAYMHQMMYRRDVLEQLGLPVPETWDEFRSTLLAIKNAGLSIIPFGVSYARSFDGQQFLIGLIMAYGGRVLSEDGSKVVFNSPETVEALKFAAGLYWDGLVDPTVLGWDDATNNQAMLAGRIAFTFNGFSIKMQAEKDFPELSPKIGVTVYPAGPQGRFTFPTILSYAVRASTKYPDLAKDLLRFLFRRDNYQYVLEFTLGAIGTVFQGFAALDIWRHPDWRSNMDAVATAKLFAPPSRQTAEAWESFVIVDMLADVLVRAMAPEAAVAKASAKLAQIYGLPEQ
ncbi:MAG: extracellular solute-binding protein [Candidatus Bathyarchaeia archaeon]